MTKKKFLLNIANLSKIQSASNVSECKIPYKITHKYVHVKHVEATMMFLLPKTYTTIYKFKYRSLEMFRAIPEVSHICSMADRGRQYRLHQEALEKIKGRSKSKIAVRSKSSICGQPLRPYSLKGKVQKEEQMRIEQENLKMKNALLKCNPTINRKELQVLDKDHQHQVKRMAGFRREVYGFPTEEKLTNTKRPMRKPSELQTTKVEEDEQPQQMTTTKAKKPAPAPKSEPKPEQAAKTNEEEPKLEQVEFFGMKKDELKETEAVEQEEKGAEEQNDAGELPQILDDVVQQM